jgi:hypothetical protein
MANSEPTLTTVSLVIFPSKTWSDTKESGQISVEFKEEMVNSSKNRKVYLWRVSSSNRQLANIKACPSWAPPKTLTDLFLMEVAKEHLLPPDRFQVVLAGE